MSNQKSKGSWTTNEKLRTIAAENDLAYSDLMEIMEAAKGTISGWVNNMYEVPFSKIEKLVKHVKEK